MLTDILLKHQIEDMAYESVGFTGGDLNVTNGTAIETIEKTSMVSPNILSMPEVVEKYGFLVEFAKDMFLLILLIWLIAYVIQHFDVDQYGKYASIIPFMKRGMIAAIMIGCGLHFYQMLMDLAYELSVKFGGSDNLMMCLTGPFIGDLGCLMTGVSCMMISYMGVFYLCRLILLIVGLGFWVLGWLMWFMGAGHSAIHYKMESMGMFLLQFVITNIFMGFIMCFVFWLGVLVVDVTSVLGNIGSWGGYMIGLCFVVISAAVPIIAFIWLFKNPRYMIHKVSGGVL